MPNAGGVYEYNQHILEIMAKTKPIKVTHDEIIYSKVAKFHQAKFNCFYGGLKVETTISAKSREELDLKIKNFFKD